MNTFRSDSPEQTRAFARDFSSRLKPASVIALHGDLGSGKTCFVQGLAGGLGVHEMVSSPTYLILHEYRGDTELDHMDFYRIESAAEVLAFGFEEYLDSKSVLAIEWPEVALELLPESTWHIFFECGQEENERLIRIDGGDADADPGD